MIAIALLPAVPYIRSDGKLQIRDACQNHNGILGAAI
jgi:hypothetical protein